MLALYFLVFCFLAFVLFFSGLWIFVRRMRKWSLEKNRGFFAFFSPFLLATVLLLYAFFFLLPLGQDALEWLNGQQLTETVQSRKTLSFLGNWETDKGSFRFLSFEQSVEMGQQYKIQYLSHSRFVLHLEQETGEGTEASNKPSPAPQPSATTVSGITSPVTVAPSSSESAKEDQP